MSERVILRDYRITIPKKIRDRLGLKDGSIFEVQVENGRIVLKLIKA